MTSFLFGAAASLLAMVAISLFVILRRSAEIDHMMAAQLLGTVGVAILLLLAVATETPSIVQAPGLVYFGMTTLTCHVPSVEVPVDGVVAVPVA